MAYLHQRLAQDTQDKASATSKPEDEAENFHNHVNETLPITLHATIISIDLHQFFFSFYSSNSEGENELRQWLGHRHPAYNFLKCFGYILFFMVNPRSIDRKEGLQRRASLEVGEAPPLSGAYSLVRYPLVPEQGLRHSCQTEKFHRSPGPDLTLDRGGMKTREAQVPTSDYSLAKGF